MKMPIKIDYKKSHQLTQTAVVAIPVPNLLEKSREAMAEHESPTAA
jgi:hypothetical protein